MACVVLANGGFESSEEYKRAFLRVPVFGYLAGKHAASRAPEQAER
jgi:hypothetical protein